MDLLQYEFFYVIQVVRLLTLMLTQITFKWSVLLMGPKNRTLVRIRTYTLNGPILVRKMGLSPILDFCKGGPFSLFLS